MREMLEAIGAPSVDALFEQVPAVRLGQPLGLPAGVAEQEIVADVRGLAARNRSADDLVCFAGAGAYDHYIPSVVWALAGRSEFYTSYTPYQPELSQGTLQTLFEFQSMICELTALEVSNASLYDGATALVEAAHMCLSSDRSRVVVAAASTRVARHLHVRGRRLLDRSSRGTRWPRRDPAGGRARRGRGRRAASQRLRRPGGCPRLGRGRACAGARLIRSSTRPPRGARAAGRSRGRHRGRRGQSLGNHLAFGGPYLGLMARG